MDDVSDEIRWASAGVVLIFGFWLSAITLLLDKIYLELKKLNSKEKP
jgi:hypothetical protein